MISKVGSEKLFVKQSANVAGATALLEIGARLGLLQYIESSNYIEAAKLAEDCNLPESSVDAYLLALASAGIIECTNNQDTSETKSYTRANAFEQIKTDAGYLLWALSACRPFIENARDFLSAPKSISQGHPRDGGIVALASAWMGCKDYYPPAVNVILEQNPARLVDLGCGSGELLVEILNKLPRARGFGLDLNSTACTQARRNARVANVDERLVIQESSIQSLTQDSNCLEGADVINAMFVFHDLFPEEAEVASQVFRECYKALVKTNGVLVLTELIPYSTDERERMFSAILTFFHQEFMKRKVPTETEWKEKLYGAGFKKVQTCGIPMPGVRLITARAT